MTRNRAFTGFIAAVAASLGIWGVSTSAEDTAAMSSEMTIEERAAMCVSWPENVSKTLSHDFGRGSDTHGMSVAFARSVPHGFQVSITLATLSCKYEPVRVAERLPNKFRPGAAMIDRKQRNGPYSPMYALVEVEPEAVGVRTFILATRQVTGSVEMDQNEGLRRAG
ncbi:MAG: hypothetical protein V4681_00070 [Patescibacteria group bacterium]